MSPTNSPNHTHTHTHTLTSTGSVAASAKGKRSGNSSSSSSSSRGKSNRLTEAEEDAQMLKSANSKRRTIRLEQQPALLAEYCKMHPYQLEGLNWLIKLHDCGINGILADGTYVHNNTYTV